jgi:hypothetical protein
VTNALIVTNPTTFRQVFSKFNTANTFKRDSRPSHVPSAEATSRDHNVGYKDRPANLVSEVLLVDSELAMANKMSLSPKKPSGKWLLLIV